MSILIAGSWLGPFCSSIHSFFLTILLFPLAFFLFVFYFLSLAACLANRERERERWVREGVSQIPTEWSVSARESKGLWTHATTIMHSFTDKYTGQVIFSLTNILSIKKEKSAQLRLPLWKIHHPPRLLGLCVPSVLFFWPFVPLQCLPLVYHLPWQMAHTRSAI